MRLGTVRIASSASLIVCAVAFQACGSRGNPLLKVGSDANGGPNFTPGGIDASDGLDAQIQQNGVAVSIVTVSCSQGCADVVSVATGGNPPYSFTWENGSTDPSRHVCPTSDTAYAVTVRDTGETGEISHAASTVKVPLTADVLACPDGGGGSFGACLPGNYSGTFDAAGNGGVNGDASSANGPVTFALAIGDGGSGELVPIGFHRLQLGAHRSDQRAAVGPARLRDGRLHGRGPDRVVDRRRAFDRRVRPEDDRAPGPGDGGAQRRIHGPVHDRIERAARRPGRLGRHVDGDANAVSSPRRRPPRYGESTHCTSSSVIPSGPSNSRSRRRR